MRRTSLAVMLVLVFSASMGFAQEGRTGAGRFEVTALPGALADLPLAKTKPFFVGGRSAEIQAKKPLTRKLVGFTLTNETAPSPGDCPLLRKGEETVGRVTSAVRSPSRNRVVALA